MDFFRNNLMKDIFPDEVDKIIWDSQGEAKKNRQVLVGNEKLHRPHADRLVSRG